MGRRNRKTAQSFRPLEKANDSVAISKQKKLEKEKEFLDKFDERQNVIPAVSLKSVAVSDACLPSATSTPMNRKGKKQKERRSDGNLAVHRTLKQVIVERSEMAKGNGVSHRIKGKRKVTFSSESSGTENWADEQRLEAENKLRTGSQALIKRVKMAIESDSDRASADNNLTDERFSEGDITQENEEQSLNDDLEGEEIRDDLEDEEIGDDLEDEEIGDDLEDEEIGDDLEDEEIGDDLEDEELERADTEELRNGDLEEEEAGSSFFTSDDESLEDGIGGESDEESFESAEFIGYQSTAKSAKCLVLEVLEDYTIATSPFVLFKFSDGADHSVQVANKALQWVVGPIDSQIFFNDLFQKRVLMIRRKSKDYFDGFFAITDFFEVLQKFDMDFGTDVNLSVYENGKTTTHNETDGVDRATPAAVWEHIGRGRTAQLVQPQRYNDNIWYLCEILQELFCSAVGAQCYLTSSNSVGIAPHWEGVDAFLLQVEGRQYFKVYSPASDEDSLPLESSCHMTELDVGAREPTFEGWMEQGDTLYIPRGWIYLANADDVHSLHVTVSVCCRHSFADFLEKASAEFIKTLVSGSKYLRQNLPPLLLDMSGICGNDYPGESTLEKKIIPIAEIFSRKFGEKFASYVPSYIDLMAREFFLFALPPLLTSEEKAKICFGNEIGSSDIGKETEVRLVRKHTQRLLFETTDNAFIVHRMANSRSSRANYSEKTIDFPIEFEDGFVTLVDTYPNWVKVRELGLESQEANVHLANLLFRNGILLVQRGETFDDEKTECKETEMDETKSGRKVGKGQQQKAEEEVGNNSVKKDKKKRRKRKKGDGDGTKRTKRQTD